ERFGALDIFIGNAAILGPLSPVGHDKPRDWEKEFTINVMANIRLVRTLHPVLEKSPAGRVVFTTSGMAESCDAYWGPYATTKAALNVFAKTYAAENGNTNMRINLVSPGVVDTAMIHEAFSGGYQKSMKKPEDVVSAYL